MAAVVHNPLKNIALNANCNWGMPTGSEDLQDLKINVTLFWNTYGKPRMRFYIPNYDINRTGRQDGKKGGNAIAFKKVFLTLT
jgi:hypothetical protein